MDVVFRYDENLTSNTSTQLVKMVRDKITSYVKTHSYKNNIEIMHDGEEILNTGGGVKNIINKSTEENFIIFNPF